MSDKNKPVKNDFQFVGQDRKVYDQQIEGKPIGYLQDAFIRFRRNKANIVVAVILIILIMMSILVPIVTTKNYEVIEEQLGYLAPRVPVLEKIGLFDGNKKVKKELVDLSTIDKNTNLGLPEGYDINFVKKGTLKNYRDAASPNDKNSLGGEVKFIIGDEETSYGVHRENPIRLEDRGVNFKMKVTNVDNLGEDGKVVLYIKYRNRDFPIIETNRAGEFNHDLELPNGSVNSLIYLKVVSNNPGASATIDYIEATHGDTKLFRDETQSLNEYIDFEAEGAGTKYRVNNYSIYAAFEYLNYQAIFSTREIKIGAVEYDELRLNNPTNDPIEDPDNPGQFIFEEEGYVIKRIVKVSKSTIAGVEYTTYDLVVDYAKYSGFDNIPFFLFGTDASGRDLFALTWVGLRTSLIIGVIVSVINISFGVVYGAISGYYGGKVDLVMERFTEIIGRIPWLVTLSIFTALIGPGFLTLVIILIISGWIGVASVTRTQFYRYKNSEYVLASRTLGAKDSRLIFRHILPNGIGTIITSSILMIPGVIFSESSISYLGFGIGHGQTINFFGLKLSGASLGVLLSEGQIALIDYPHLTIYPAIIISLLMIAFNIFGNGLRDAFNPSLRGTE